MDYTTANYFLGEAETPQIASTRSKIEAIDKQIAQLKEQKKKYQADLVRMGDVEVSVVKEDANFEMEMLLSEKDKAKKAYQGKNISFLNFNKKGVEDETAAIKTDVYTLYFRHDGISYYKGDEQVSKRYYDDIYKMADSVKWKTIFDFKTLPAI